MAKGWSRTRRASRERAERCVILRSRGLTWQQVADEVGLPSRGAAERAAKAELDRTSPDSPGTARRYLLANARDTAARWHVAFENAAAARDVEGMISAHAGLVKDRDMQARLTGSYMPTEVNATVGISSETFGARMAEIVQVLGADEAMRVAAAAPGAAAALPPALRDRVFAERVEPVEDVEPWANIGVDEPPRAIHAVYDARSGVVVERSGGHPAESQSEAFTDVSAAEAEPETVDDAEPEVVEAELVDEVYEVVALPPGQRRVSAAEGYVDADGVPYGRGGYSRRLQREVPGNGSDGPRFGGYDPRRGSVLGRGPVLTGDDPMPLVPPPSRG